MSIRIRIVLAALAVALLVAVAQRTTGPPTVAATAEPPSASSSPTPSTAAAQLEPELEPVAAEAPVEAVVVEEPVAAPPVVTTPTAEPEPEPAPPVPSGSVEEAIAMYFGDVYQQAWNVSGCESGHDPSAVSPGGGNWGLFQINVVHKRRVANMGYSWDQILDPFVNAAVARAIYDEQGWGPWTCRWAAYS